MNRLSTRRRDELTAIAKQIAPGIASLCWEADSDCQPDDAWIRGALMWHLLKDVLNLEVSRSLAFVESQREMAKAAGEGKHD